MKLLDRIIPTSRENLKPLTTFLMEYEVGDRLGQLLSLISLTPLFLLISYVSLIWGTRDVTYAFFFIGQLFCEVTNLALKTWWQQRRPTDFLGKGFGMPSSHSMFVGYFAVYTLIHLWFRSKSTCTLSKSFHSLAVVSWAILVAYSRVYLHYHTLNQVLIGLSFGLAFALIWDFVVEILIRPSKIFEYLIKHPLSAYLKIKDSRDIVDPLTLEYEMWVKAKSSHLKEN